MAPLQVPLDPSIASSQLEDFFAGAPTLASVLSGIPPPVTQLGVRRFLQDDWRATRTLTINLGVRYEFNSVLKEAHNLLGNFDPTLGIVQVGNRLALPITPTTRISHRAWASPGIQPAKEPP